jgi:hypothetical protein
MCVPCKTRILAGKDNALTIPALQRSSHAGHTAQPRSTQMDAACCLDACKVQSKRGVTECQLCQVEGTLQ